MRSFARVILLIMIMTFTLTLLVRLAFGGSAIGIWDYNEIGTPDLVGYRFYYSQTTGVYSEYVQVLKGTKEAVITGLTEGVEYFFVVTAYDTSNLESVYSLETSATIPLVDTTPPPAPGQPTIEVIVRISQP